MKFHDMTTREQRMYVPREGKTLGLAFGMFLLLAVVTIL